MNLLMRYTLNLFLCTVYDGLLITIGYCLYQFVYQIPPESVTHYLIYTSWIAALCALVFNLDGLQDLFLFSSDQYEMFERCPL